MPKKLKIFHLIKMVCCNNNDPSMKEPRLYSTIPSNDLYSNRTTNNTKEKKTQLV